MAHSDAKGVSIPTELVARLEAGERSNALDVLVEVALFQPDEITFDAVPNAAGTKVIYANRDGSFSTHWARDWSLRPAEAIAILKATAASSVGTKDEVRSEPNPTETGRMEP